MSAATEAEQLALFRPAALQLIEDATHFQVVASVKFDDVPLYLTADRSWSPDLQQAEPYSCQGIAAAFVRNALCRDPADSELVKYLPVRRGLVVLA